VREHSHSAEQLEQFLGSLGVTLLGHLRDTQNYLHLAAHGLTLWDVAPSRVERDLELWQPLLAWADAPVGKA
jgi:chromosome partitioning protein